MSFRIRSSVRLHIPDLASRYGGGDSTSAVDHRSGRDESFSLEDSHVCRSPARSAGLFLVGGVAPGVTTATALTQSLFLEDCSVVQFQAKPPRPIAGTGDSAPAVYNRQCATAYPPSSTVREGPVGEKLGAGSETTRVRQLPQEVLRPQSPPRAAPGE